MPVWTIDGVFRAALEPAGRVMMPFLLVGFALPEPLYGAPLALVMPLVSLVYANVVVAFESRQS